MTKEVQITIRGIQDQEEAIHLSAPGIYHQTRGRHYIQYKEKLSEDQGVTKNTIKITPTQIELIKKGTELSRMVFDLKESTQTIYNTPYGGFAMKIHTSSILLNESADQINVALEYTLSTEKEHISKNKLSLIITSKGISSN